MDDLMESVFKDNVTLTKVNFFNMTNSSNVSEVRLYDLYEAYRSREKDQLIMYRWIAYILGTLIIISNLTVVISSGLILRKGQQHKSTYLLLGNVSLADTIIGFSIIFGTVVDNSLKSNQVCIFQLGMLVCPAIVSIFSVGLIAVDRYIYILHGLYYQRWFNTTRVRIGILCIWMIGICFGFLPATGWVNHELLENSRCHYVAIFPGALILFNSLLSTLPIIIVTILYFIILLQALKNLKKIKVTEASVKANLANLNSDDNKPKLRINRGNTKTVNNTGCVDAKHKMKRSASFCTHNSNINIQRTDIASRAKSIDDINTIKPTEHYVNGKYTYKDRNESRFSVCTVETSCSSRVNSIADITQTANMDSNNMKSCVKKNTKVKGPNKWRAVTIVTLTSFSFIITWMPFFVTVTLFVFCEEKLTNTKCFYMRSLLSGPLAVLAFINSVLNPLIYAWWHKGFKRSLKNYFRKYFQRYCLKR